MIDSVSKITFNSRVFRGELKRAACVELFAVIRREFCTKALTDLLMWLEFIFNFALPLCTDFGKKSIVILFKSTGNAESNFNKMFHGIYVDFHKYRYVDIYYVVNMNKGIKFQDIFTLYHNNLILGETAKTKHR